MSNILDDLAVGSTYREIIERYPDICEEDSNAAPGFSSKRSQ
ncbi:MAG: DUF433 domain-containing protein [Spirochaetales bacterium]|nr:DUF433 domain-containing protein [Spirochaetales bacterium]